MTPSESPRRSLAGEGAQLRPRDELLAMLDERVRRALADELTASFQTTSLMSEAAERIRADAAKDAQLAAVTARVERMAEAVMATDTKASRTNPNQTFIDTRAWEGIRAEARAIQPPEA